MENEIKDKMIENQDNNVIEKPQNTEVKQEKISEEEWKDAKRRFRNWLLLAAVIVCLVFLIEAFDIGYIITSIVLVVVAIIFLIRKFSK